MIAYLAEPNRPHDFNTNPESTVQWTNFLRKAWMSTTADEGMVFNRFVRSQRPREDSAYFRGPNSKNCAYELVVGLMVSMTLIFWRRRYQQRIDETA